MSKRIAWWPLVFAGFVAFVPINLARTGHATGSAWTLTALAVVSYVGLFSVVVARWQQRRPFFWVLVPLVLLGFLESPISFPAVIFFWSAACIAPWAVRGDIARTIQIVIPLLLALAWEGWLTSNPGLQQWWYFHTPLLLIVMAAGNTWMVRALASAQRLAQIAERERIARDLHDVLGHTLSVITLKAELAGWLLTQPNGRERVCKEMADVEKISARALADVRETILGEQEETLVAELQRAAETLRTAGIALACIDEHSRIDAAQEQILCLALREAVTNIVRHANARSCRVRLQTEPDGHVLEVQDDGRGGSFREGQGLKGMRERAEAGGGSVSRDVSTGTRLTVRLPLLQEMT